MRENATFLPSATTPAPAATLSVTDAYRADIGNAVPPVDSARAGLWIALGTILGRAVSLDHVNRASYLRTAVALLDPTVNGATLNERTAAYRGLLAEARSALEPAILVEALCAFALRVAEEAEDAAAFATATVILDGCRYLLGQLNPRILGRALVQQARIFRKLGDFDQALDLYEKVAALAHSTNDDELLARGELGAGAVARVRGNYPAAREHFHQVLRIDAADTAIQELHTQAHHGLVIAAAVARDFETALRHGSLALETALHRDVRIEVLANVGGVCLLIGQYRAALNSGLRVLADATQTRIRLAALGTVALAAAYLNEREVVAQVAAAAREGMGRDQHAFEMADMLRELGQAYVVLGDQATAAPYLEEARARAQRNGFFEILHQLDATAAPKAIDRAVASLPQDVQGIAEDLASGDSVELLVAAGVTGRWGQ